MTTFLRKANPITALNRAIDAVDEWVDRISHTPRHLHRSRYMEALVNG